MGQMYFPNEDRGEGEWLSWVLIILLAINSIIWVVLYVNTNNDRRKYEQKYYKEQSKVSSLNEEISKLKSEIAFSSSSYKEDIVEVGRNWSTTYSSYKPAAEISKAWLEHNVWEKDLYGEKTNGLKIHINFVAHNYKDQNCKVLTFFYEEDYHNTIKGKKDQYKSNDGTACVVGLAKPDYDHCRWKDYSLFMPYSEFDCNKSQIVSFILVVRDSNNNEMDRVNGKFRFIKN